MAKIILNKVRKEYPFVSNKRADKGKTVVAVEEFNMEIKDGEFVVFVGPSGCGKSTTLRMIAGLESITSGDLYIGDLRVNDIPAKDRNISMVFQNYALYPHMTVYQNICFPLNYARFHHPVKARKQEIINAHKEIEFGNRMIAKMDKLGVDKIKDYTRQEILEKISFNTEVLENSTKLLDEAIKHLASIAPTKEEIKKAKYLEKHSKNYKEDESWQKCRTYYELTRTKYSKKDKDEIVHRVAKLVDVEQYLERKPKALSGGQRQRVALARALVRSPKAFLLDEPLSNLDAKLRTAMRSEIVELHKKIGTTFVYVTHDQVEAMTMGDRIVVMSMGKVQQISTPTDLFDHPKNKFVAGFIGTPQMNFLKATMKKATTNLVLTFENGDTLKLPLKSLGTIDKKYLDGDIHPVTVGVRSEDLSIASKGLKGIVGALEVLGNETHIFVKSGQEKDIIIRTYNRTDVKIGDSITYTINPEKLHLFEVDGDENAILLR